MSMNDDIKKYPVYKFIPKRGLIRINIESVNNYSHFEFNLHHYIKKGEYKRNKAWYEERGIQQKLILMPVEVHEQVHLQAVKNLTDEEFQEKYKISRWELLFNRRYSNY